MRRFFLRFTDLALEKEFQLLNKSFMHGRFFLFLKMQFLFLMIILFVFLFKNPSTDIVFCIALIPLALLLPVVLKKWYRILFDLIIMVIISLMGILFVELIKFFQTENGLFSVEGLLLLLPFEFYVMLTLLSRMNWIFCSFVYFMNIFYLLLRVFDMGNSHKEFVIIGSVLLILGFGTMCYSQEKTTREFFAKLRETKDNLKQFKFLLETVLPSPIFILNFPENKIEFINKSGSELLNRRRIMTFLDEQIEEGIFNNLKKDPKISMENFEQFIDHFKLLDAQDQEKSTENTSIFHIFKTFSRFSILKNEHFRTFHICSGENPSNGTLVAFDINQVAFSNKSYYEMKIVNIVWDGKPCIFVILNNNTNSKRLLEMMDLDQYKNRMLATVSHDLRTPLNGIVGMLESVILTLNDEKLRESLIIAIRSANLLNCLINDILDFSQITYKKLRLSIEKIVIKDLIQEIYQMLRITAEKKGIEFSVEFELDDIENIDSDPNRLRQILINLASNAIKFTSNGFVRLKIKTVHQNNQTLVKFAVEDSGVGIKREEMSKLFTFFGKLHQDDPEVNKTGIGFGLTISNTLAKMLYTGTNSGVFVESEYGKGSVFWFMIEVKGKVDTFISLAGIEMHEHSREFFDWKITEYLTEGSDTQRRLTTQNTRITEGIDTQRRLMTQNMQINSQNQYKCIMIVDDDPINLMVLEKYISYFQQDFIKCSNGLEAVETVEREVVMKSREIDLILMDCNMPIMNGFKAAELIQETLSKNRRKIIPIIAVTANVTHADEELCVQSGMTAVLCKPVRRKDLSMLLKRILGVAIDD